MSLLQKITPINLLEEKEKFFADVTYNPQFEYEEEINPEELYSYGLPDPELVSKAIKIIDQTFSHHTEKEILELGGKQVNQAQVEEKIKTFLRLHGLEKKYSLVFSSSFIARASVTNDAIKVRLPIHFYEKDLLGMIYHELGTHALRQINYEQQPWYKKKKKHGFKSYLVTEEGLAVLHSLIPHPFKLAYRPARYYLATQLAQEYGFSDLYQKLEPLFPDVEKRWTATLRQKRGLKDTSKKGGFTKDLVYFQGIVEMYTWLKEHDFDLRGLYFGKVAKEDVAKAMTMNPHYMPVLPSFFLADENLYKEQIITIGKTNNLH